MAPEQRRRTREGQRDITTLTVGAVVTIFAKVFDIVDPELIGAITTLLIIMCHRGIPDVAGKK